MTARLLPFPIIGFVFAWATDVQGSSPIAVMAVAGVVFIPWLAIALRAPSLSSASRIEPVPVSPLRASINYREGEIA